MTMMMPQVVVAIVAAAAAAMALPLQAHPSTRARGGCGPMHVALLAAAHDPAGWRDDRRRHWQCDVMSGLDVMLRSIYIHIHIYIHMYVQWSCQHAELMHGSLNLLGDEGRKSIRTSTPLFSPHW